MTKHANDTPLAADTVAHWLKQHPDFFMGRDALLADLELPHDTGAAVSLVARQVGVLRDRNRDLRQRMHHLLDAARQNDRLFENSRKLVLGLLEAQSLEELLVAVEESLSQDFHADCHRVLIYDRSELPAIGQVQGVTSDAVREALGGLMEGGKPVCGVLRERERNFLFGDNGGKVASAAVVPLKGVNLLGLLAIGSRDPHRFESQMGTLFLEYLADILGRLLPRLLPED